MDFKKTLIGSCLMAVLSIGSVGSAIAMSSVERAAFEACGHAVRASLHDPRSLRWDRRNVRISETPLGILVLRPFTASNAFGGTVRQEARCLYNTETRRLSAFDVQ